MSKRASISDVARLAGVGVGSVSRVINQAAAVSPGMRERVHAAMERLGYTPGEPHDRPGPKHRRSAPPASRRAVVELVVISRLGLGWMEEQAPVYASVFDGIEEALTAAGCELVVRQIERWPASFPANDPPMAGRIFFGADDTRTRPSGFPLAPPSIWLMGSPPAWFAGDIIHIDHMAVGQLAAQEAIRLGHRSCVYLGTALGSPSARLGYRADAFLHHLQALGGQAQMIIDPSLIDMTRTANCASVERIRAALAPLLRRPSRPSAICVQADMLTPAVYQCLSDVGLRPQRDVTVISCNNEARYLRSLKPPPIVIDVQAVQVGKQAVDTLLWRIGHPAAPALHLAIRPVLAP